MLSHNEWDPLEEVIVGRLDGATIPSNHPVVTCNVPPWAARLQGLAAGFRYPRSLLRQAQRELDDFVALLQSLGDAADFVRAGRDLFVTRSNVTNAMGIEWLRRHLGSGYRIHEIESRCRAPMHIDTTFVLLGPGRALVNPEYVDVDRLPGVLDSWDILVAPEPDPIRDPLLKVTSMCGKWLSMNVLMIDEKRVIAERHHTGMLRALEGWGFDPIPCDLLHYAPFGGSFHCATLDIRRRGALESSCG